MIPKNTEPLVPLANYEVFPGITMGVLVLQNTKKYCTLPIVCFGRIHCHGISWYQLKSVNISSWRNPKYWPLVFRLDGLWINTLDILFIGCGASGHMVWQNYGHLR